MKTLAFLSLRPVVEVLPHHDALLYASLCDHECMMSMHPTP